MAKRKTTRKTGAARTRRTAAPDLSAPVFGAAPACGTCVWFTPGFTPVTGVCERFPPQPVVAPNQPLVWRQPVTMTTWVCGEWVPQGLGSDAHES